MLFDIFIIGLEFHIDNIFLAMASQQGMLAGGLKSPYAVLHQSHTTRGPHARVGHIGLEEIAQNVGLNPNNIEVGQPFTYANPKWGLAGVDMHEVCFIKGIRQPGPCLIEERRHMFTECPQPNS